MVPFPHRYSASASFAASPHVLVHTATAPDLVTAAPAEFDGPGRVWSPETLLMGAVADCYAITFRGVARAMRLTWDHLTCDVDGVLDRADAVVRFTHVIIRVRLAVPPTADHDLARRVLDKVKSSCLITNSLNAEVRLDAAIETRTIESHVAVL